MIKRRIILDIGFSPGDIVVFTAALRDLCIQNPDFDISINTCCPAIFENNPHLIKKPTDKPLRVNCQLDGLKALGYELTDIPNHSQDIFNELMKARKLRIERAGHRYQYIHNEKNILLFDIDIEDKTKLESEHYTIKYEDIHNSGSSGRHFSTAFYIEFQDILGVDVEQTSLLPDLHLSDEEKGWSNQVEDVHGYKGKFWLINAGHKNDYPAKQWPLEYWQKLVELLKDKVQFVQIGEKGANHNHQLLNGTLDMIGKTDLRQLIRLSYHAEGGISHVSLLHHLMAAWQKPCVTLAGGREARRWEMYPSNRYMDTNGLLPCCSYDGCWMSGKVHHDEGVNKKCKNLVGGLQRCMKLITPEQVAQEVINLEANSMPLHAKLTQEIKELKWKNKAPRDKPYTDSDKLQKKISEALIKNLEKKRESL